MTGPVDNPGGEPAVGPTLPAMTNKDLLTAAGVAHLLDIDEDEAIELIRRIAPAGAIRTNDADWMVPTSALEQLRTAHEEGP